MGAVVGGAGPNRSRFSGFEGHGGVGGPGPTAQGHQRPVEGTDIPFAIAARLWLLQVDIDFGMGSNGFRPVGNSAKDISVTRFLNRLLGLESRKQNMLFEVPNLAYLCITRHDVLTCLCTDMRFYISNHPTTYSRICSLTCSLTYPLLRSLFLRYSSPQCTDQAYVDMLDRIIRSAKREGSYDQGSMEIAGPGVFEERAPVCVYERKVSEPETVIRITIRTL